MLYEKLSDLTPSTVDSIYGIDTATPVEKPVFVFMIGSPGAGKSQGHAQLAELEILADKNYCTINLDSLLESLKPFRAGSAIGHLLKNYLGELYPRAPEGAPKSAPKPKSPSFIHAYQSTTENVGSFLYYNDPYTRSELEKAVNARLGKNMVEEADIAARRGEIFAELNAIRGKFPKSVSAAGESIIAINDAAIRRAVEKGINIVYETTLDIAADGTVKKFDKIYTMLLPTPYIIHLLKIEDSVEHVQQKIKTRQEYGMPYEEYPFYRYVPFGRNIVSSYITKNDLAFSRILDGITSRKYDISRILFHEYTSKFNAARLNPAIEFDFMSQMNRIKKAYSGGKRRQTRRHRSSRRRNKTYRKQK